MSVKTLSEDDMASALRMAGYVVMYPSGRDAKRAAAKAPATNTSISRAGKSGSYGAPRSGRAANATSAAGPMVTGAGGSKVAKTAQSSMPAHVSRFAHLAGDSGATLLPATVPVAAETPVMRRPLTRAEMTRQAAAHPGYASADDTAAAVLAVHKKLGGR